VPQDTAVAKNVVHGLVQKTRNSVGFIVRRPVGLVEGKGRLDVESVLGEYGVGVGTGEGMGVVMVSSWGLGKELGVALSV